MRSPNLLRMMVAVGIVLPATLFFLAACSRNGSPYGLTTARKETPTSNAFVGSAACAECHQAVFRSHKGTRHALALRFMNTESLGKQAPEAGFIPESNYALTSFGDGFGFGRIGEPAHPLHLVFGSGKSGMAFASVVGDAALAEARMSYYPPYKRWFVTPGQNRLPAGSLGNITQGAPARQCIGCHVVTIPVDSVMPEERFLGVGCESCHGMGAAHMAAMRGGAKATGGMEHLANAGGARMNDLCGRCHRTEREVLSKDLAHENTDLFQAYGLAQSRCFKESGDHLTCVTCHNPHADVVTREKAYTAACLKCHVPSGLSKPSAPAPISVKVCPVNPITGCTGCHMPKRVESLFPGSPRRVADHFIRIYH